MQLIAILTLPLLPLLALFILINELIRSLVTLVLQYSNSKVKGQITQLSPSGYDSIYAYKSHPEGRRTVLYLAVLAPGDFDIKKHQRNYQNHVLHRREFGKLKKTWTQCYGYVCLREDNNFDVRRHVRVYGSGVDEVTEEKLMGEIMPELSRDFEDESKPQWEDLILRNFVKNNGTKHNLRIFRTHHGYCDGISNLLMLASTQNDLESFPWVVDPLKPRNSGALFYYLYFLLHLPIVALEHGYNWLFKKPNWVPESYTGDTIHGWSEVIDVETIQKIRTGSKCSMPAILTSVLISALRRSFPERFTQTQEGDNKSDRMALGLVTALLPYPSLDLTNNHSILRCSLDSSDLPRRARLTSVDAELNGLSRSPHVWLNHILPSIYGRFPVPICNLFTGLMTGDGVVSNFPATREKVTLWGWEVEEMSGWVPLLTRAGFGCVTLRYANGLRYSLNADSSVMTREEMGTLLKMIVEEVGNLEKEVGRGGGSLVVGRFLVCPVEKEDGGQEDGNNNQVVDEKIEKNIEIEKSREDRIRGVLRKIIYSFDKIKRGV